MSRQTPEELYDSIVSAFYEVERAGITIGSIVLSQENYDCIRAIKDTSPLFYDGEFFRLHSFPLVPDAECEDDTFRIRGVHCDGGRAVTETFTIGGPHT